MAEIKSFSLFRPTGLQTRVISSDKSESGNIGIQPRPGFTFPRLAADKQEE